MSSYMYIIIEFAILAFLKSQRVAIDRVLVLKGTHMQ